MGRKESLSWDPKATENDACGSLVPRVELESINKFSRISRGLSNAPVSQGGFKVTNDSETGVFPFLFFFLNRCSEDGHHSYLMEKTMYVFNSIFGLVMHQIIL